MTPDLTARFSAVDLVRVASETLGGKGGGGRPDMAQAGGPDGGKAAEALDYIPMPDNVVGMIRKAWAAEIRTADGKPVYQK